MLLRQSTQPSKFIVLLCFAAVVTVIITSVKVISFNYQKTSDESKEQSASDIVKCHSLAGKQPAVNSHGGSKKAEGQQQPSGAASVRTLDGESRKFCGEKAKIAHSQAKATPFANKWDPYRLDISSTSPSGSHGYWMAAVCADTACGEKFLQKFTQRDKQPRVPAIRHILWKSEKVSKYYMQQLKSWQKIHPDWTFVLWRDSDLEPFVRKHFPGKIHQKYKSLPTSGQHGIKRIDMFRYMLLYKFGGVYADLDYTLVSNLDRYRRYPAVVTREPEAHSAQVFGLHRWPLSVISNLAFLMSAPGHPFFKFAVHQLLERSSTHIMEFAGPMGLNNILSAYYDQHLAMEQPSEFVYIPPSYSFYAYTGNNLKTGGHVYLKMRIQALQKACSEVTGSIVPPVIQFCKNVTNLNPITDKTQPLVAIHDLQKKNAVYDDERGKEFASDMQNVMQHLRGLKLGNALI